jgi:hypothetical protein
VPGCGKKRGCRRVLGVAHALIIVTQVVAEVPRALVERRKEGRSKEEEGDWGRLQLGPKLGWLRLKMVMGMYLTGSGHPYPYPHPQNFTRRVTRTCMRVKNSFIPVPAG